MRGRSSHRRCSVKRGVSENFTIFTGKQLCCSLFLIKLQILRPATLLTETPKQLFSCEYCEILRTSILKNICERLLLEREKPKEKNNGIFCWHGVLRQIVKLVHTKNHFSLLNLFIQSFLSHLLWVNWLCFLPYSLYPNVMRRYSWKNIWKNLFLPWENIVLLKKFENSGNKNKK